MMDIVIRECMIYSKVISIRYIIFSFNHLSCKRWRHCVLDVAELMMTLELEQRGVEHICFMKKRGGEQNDCHDNI